MVSKGLKESTSDEETRIEILVQVDNKDLAKANNYLLLEYLVFMQKFPFLVSLLFGALVDCFNLTILYYFLLHYSAISAITQWGNYWQLLPTTRINGQMFS